MDFAAETKDGGVFRHALNMLVQRLGAELPPRPTPISIFKTKYNGILKDADHGTVQVISRGSRRYVLLTESQLVEMMSIGFVSGWARHLDRAADSGLRLPAVWQQFLDAAVQVRWQSCQHVPQIGPRVMAMQPG